MPDQVLNLWKENLATVHGAIWNDPGIVLILADNALSTISPRIGELQRLRTFDLGHNQLTELPVELGNLTGIRDFLYLHDNRLKSLPQSLAGLHMLRYLNISESRFSAFPEAVCHMLGWLSCSPPITNCPICPVQSPGCRDCANSI